MKVKYNLHPDSKGLLTVVKDNIELGSKLLFTQVKPFEGAFICYCRTIADAASSGSYHITYHSVESLKGFEYPPIINCVRKCDPTHEFALMIIIVINKKSFLVATHIIDRDVCDEKPKRVVKMFTHTTCTIPISKCTVCLGDAHLYCSTCKNIKYCSRKCQRRDWHTHKGRCGDLKQLKFTVRNELK
mgnify:CR=1 FL=1